jgi:hypothetical protein
MLTALLILALILILLAISMLFGREDALTNDRVRSGNGDSHSHYTHNDK